MAVVSLRSESLSVVRLAATVHETLSPFMTEMRENLAAVTTEMRESLAAVNTKVDSLSRDLKEDKNKTTTEQNILTNVTKQLKKTAEYVLQHSRTYECGGTGGWRRVVYLNMTDPKTNCPSGWQLTSHSKRTCGRVNTGYSLSCDSVFFSVGGGDYSSVCGSIIAYQDDAMDAFEPYDEQRVTTIEGAYVCGVSLTHGSPRQHIWTFAAGASEALPTYNDVCPCDAIINITVPSFVSGDYFCESGANSGSATGFHPDDPLWDGEGCSSHSSCCSFNEPPYFTKHLPSPTTEPIEARLCRWETIDDSPVEFMELYVK